MSDARVCVARQCAWPPDLPTHAKPKVSFVAIADSAGFLIRGTRLIGQLHDTCRKAADG